MARLRNPFLRSACLPAPFLLATLAIGCGRTDSELDRLRGEVERLRGEVEAERSARAAAEEQLAQMRAAGTESSARAEEQDDASAVSVCDVQAAFGANAVAAEREYPEGVVRRVSAVVGRVGASSMGSGGWIEPEGCRRATLDLEDSAVLASLSPGDAITATCHRFGWYRGGMTWDSCVIEARP